jgi:Tfp pilus assembly protein PilO
VSLWQRVYTERRRVLLPVIALLAINGGVLLLGVLPLKRSVTLAEQSAVEARIDLANAQRQEMQARAQLDGRDRAVVELQKFYEQILPPTFARATVVTNFWLQGVAEQAGIKFHSGQWQSDEVRDSRLIEYTGQVTLTGDYSDIRQFLYRVETAEQFVIIESVELSQSSTAQDQSAIEVALAVSTYYLAPAARGARAK